jgi:hypothetical protein
MGSVMKFTKEEWKRVPEACPQEHTQSPAEMPLVFCLNVVTVVVLSISCIAFVEIVYYSS